jgi:hypothetical protein
MIPPSPLEGDGGVGDLSAGSNAASSHPPLPPTRQRSALATSPSRGEAHRLPASDQHRIIVHSLEQARAAVAAAAELRVPMMLVSAAGAGGYAGPLWFTALVDAARHDHPEAAVAAVLDCADEAGTALAALRAGVTRVRFTGPEPVRLRLAEIAAALGAAIESGPVEGALDLLDRHDPKGAALAFLAGNETQG